MINNNFSEEELSEIIEDAFVNVKEACLRLQERTKCGNEVVIKILNEVTDYYTNKEDNNKNRF
tara:strand:- start:2814 stop:3002 length:189 start_codon:yes stop_codon:yes gene_type:complete